MKKNKTSKLILITLLMNLSISFSYEKDVYISNDRIKYSNDAYVDKRGNFSLPLNDEVKIKSNRKNNIQLKSKRFNFNINLKSIFDKKK